MPDIKITDENRRQFGGDFRVRQSLTLPDGTLSPALPMNARSLIPTGPGDLIFKAKPDAEYAITAVEMSSFPAAATQRLQMLDMGYRFCIFDEWDLAPRFREIWEKSADGKIVTNAGGNYALALVACPRHLVDDRNKEYLRWSDEVEETFEEKLAETQDRFNVATGQTITHKQRMEAIERHLESQEKVSRRR